MKNSTRLLAIIALAAAIGFTMMGCDDGLGSGRDTVATPTATPATGTAVSSGATITLATTTQGAEIWYTTDNSTPAKNGSGSTKYTTPIAITTATTIKAIAVKDGMTDSGILTAAYTIASQHSNDITYSVEQEGGEDEVADSTGIVFTFSVPVDSLNLTADDITVGEKLEKDSTTTFTGSGTTWTLSPITVNHAGQATVSISKTGIEAREKNVLVYKEGEAAPTLTGITLNTDSVKKTYTQNETLDLSGLVVTASYSDNSSVAVTDYTASPADGETLSEIGTITVTITYTEETVTDTKNFDVTVSAAISTKTLSGITLNTDSVKKDYTQNEQLDLTGLIVTANYTDNPSVPVTDYTASPADGETLSEIGTRTVTISYTEETVTVTKGFDVTVSAPHVHAWGSWTFKTSPTDTVDGTEERICSSGTTPHTETRPLYAIGTAGLVYNLISINGGTDNAYSVRGGGGTTAVHIPAYHRTTANYEDYKPVTQIGNTSDNAWNNGAFVAGQIPAVTFAANSPLTTICDFAFNGVILTEITLPASVTSIGNNAFSQCWSLTSVNIPAGVTSIGTNVFSECAALRNITIDTDQLIFTTSRTWLTMFPADNLSVTFSKNIPNNAFYSASANTRLKSVTIAAGVTSIGQQAFQNCTGLTSVTIPAGVTSIGQQAFQNCTSLTSVNIPASVTSIGNNAFDGCTNLADVTFAAGSQRTTIGQQAFYNCANLVGVTFTAGSQLTTIGEYAFYNCAKITSITLSASVTSIGQYAFQNCTALTSINIPESITITTDQTSSIRFNTFTGCTALRNITIDSDKMTFTSSGSLLVMFPADNLSVTFNKDIPDLACYSGSSNTRLKNVTIATGVTSIGYRAFYNCAGITSVTIPASVTSIGEEAFSDCAMLTGISIPNSVTTIGSSTFYGCASLTSLNLGTGVMSIGSSAFRYCTGLTSITIPSSVTSIGDNAFDGCTDLTSVTFNGPIASASFGSSYYPPFPGDLRDKYFAAPGGGIGTYTATRTAGDNTTAVWTKQ
jgi:hypothetical protein